MNSVKIKFVDGGDLARPILYQTLSGEYNFIEDNCPDIIFYSFFGDEHYKFNCKKIFVSGQNSCANFNQCDYAITCNDIIFQNRHCKIPFFVFRPQYRYINQIQYEDTELQQLFNRQFCGAVISNNINFDPKRYEYFKLIHCNYKNISSAGKAFNTINRLVDDFPIQYKNQHVFNIQKYNFQINFKFSLAFENSIVNGYTTEKITESFMSKTIPIYFGNKNVNQYFDQNSFINLNAFSSDKEIIDYLQFIDNDKEAYIKMLTCKNKVKMDKDYYEIFKNFIINAINGQIFNHSFGNLVYHK